MLILLKINKKNLTLFNYLECNCLERNIIRLLTGKMGGA